MAVHYSAATDTELASPSLLKTRIKFGSYQCMFGEITWASFGPSTFTKAAVLVALVAAFEMHFVLPWL